MNLPILKGDIVESVFGDQGEVMEVGAITALVHCEDGEYRSIPLDALEVVEMLRPENMKIKKRGKRGQKEGKPVEHVKPARTCAHWRQPFEASPEVTVYLSAYMDRAKAPKETPEITHGVYLDSVWTESMPLMTNGTLHESARAGPEILKVRWPDMYGIPLARLTHVLKWIADRRSPDAVIDIGCVGGHGRTGTLVAALVMLLTGATAKDARQSVRDGYCKKAVETREQFDLLKELEGYLAQEGGDR